MFGKLIILYHLQKYLLHACMYPMEKTYRRGLEFRPSSSNPPIGGFKSNSQWM